MWISFGYILLALFGISFLIFIHELGHYLTAKWQGMRVEVFSIGFGSPLFSWEWKETQWQIGWLPIGGFVKIAGTDTEQDPYSIPDGFFGRPPLARLKVLAMGPMANFLFGILAFTVIWSLGGRERQFSEYSKTIGWLDPESELYQEGVRPGDQILSYENQPVNEARDHMLAALLADQSVSVQGYSIDYISGQKEPFQIEVSPYFRRFQGKKGLKTFGILEPASYLIYDGLEGQRSRLLTSDSPMEGSGIEVGDRLFWVNGARVFSLAHLQHILNDHRVLLTIARDGEIFHRRVPLVAVSELRPDEETREELIDWQFEADLAYTPLSDLFTIPYNLTQEGVVENRMRFIDQDVAEAAFPATYLSAEESPLEIGDRILAVHGEPIRYSYQLFQRIQSPKATIIVERRSDNFPVLPYRQALIQFDQEMGSEDLQRILESFGSDTPLTQSGSLVLLNPIRLKKSKEFLFHPEKGGVTGKRWLEKKREVEALLDPELRSQTLALMEEQENLYLLGLPVHDRKVQYNPNPFFLFWDFMKEFGVTLKALVTGNLQPQYLSGPVGIVHLIQTQSREGLKTALFWLGTISINIGLLNLLPVPMLDGGTICFTLFEMITGRRLQPKTMERLILPFALALLAFFIFLTYNDIARLVW